MASNAWRRPITTSRLCLVVLVLKFAIVCQGQIDLDKSFSQLRNQGMWLVEFYAPWCGHCQRLEPIYKEVFTELQQIASHIQVARLDSSKYSHLANEYSIRGLPTIMFIQGDKMVTYRGSRTKEAIVEFALRAQGPPTRSLDNEELLKEALQRHSDSVFFLYLADSMEDEEQELFKKYKQLAESRVVESYFYYGPKNITLNGTASSYPAVFAVKDGGLFYEFDSAEHGEASLNHFISRERFGTFPKLSAAVLDDVADVVSFVVILAVDPEDMDDPDSPSKRLFDLVRKFAVDQRQHFHREFQFGWMSDMETVNSITLTFQVPPFLLVQESESGLYYTPSNVNKLTEVSLGQYLARVSQGLEQAEGGTGLVLRLRWMLFELISLSLDIWELSRWMFLVVVGLPILFLSLLCYSLCCLDVVDSLPLESDEDLDDSLDESDVDSLPPIVKWQGDLPSIGFRDLPVKDQLEKKND